MKFEKLKDTLMINLMLSDLNVINGGYSYKFYDSIYEHYKNNSIKDIYMIYTAYILNILQA